MTLNPRHWPWWGWVAVAVLVLLIGLSVAIWRFSSRGEAELQRVIADLQAKGLLHLPGEFARTAPPVDVERQTRAYAQQQRIAAAPWSGTGHPSGMQRFTASGQAADVLLKTKQLIADSQEERSAWRALVAAGPVVLSGYGWMHQDQPRPETLGVLQAAELRVANVRAIRALAESLAAAALVAADPRPELADLDALVAALQPGASLIDAMVLGLAGQIRDQACLEATIRGSDPAPWLSVRSEVFAAVLTGITGERAWVTGGLYQDHLAGRQIEAIELLGIASDQPFASRPAWLDRATVRLVAPYDLAFAYAWEGRLEERLRGRPIALQPFASELASDSWRHPLSSLMIPNLVESAFVAIQYDVTAQRTRVAAALINAWQRTGTLPADAAGVRALLPSDLLAAHGDHPAILYTVVAPGRFRLWTDPATPPTDLLAAGRISAAKPTTAIWSDQGWSLDLDLTRLPQP